MKPLPLVTVPFLLIAAAAVAWFTATGLLVFAWHYPGIPFLAFAAYVMAREAVNPSPLTQRLRSL